MVSIFGGTKPEIKANMHSCPSCQQNRGISQMQYVLGLMEQLGKQALLEPGMSAQALLQKHDIGWACDICIDNGVAELVDEQADHKSWYPYFSYYNTEKNCLWCGTEFTYTKEEKRYWFENLRFSFHAIPSHCESCKKELFEGTPEQERCDMLLEQGGKNLSKKEKEELSTIFKAWQQFCKLKL